MSAHRWEGAIYGRVRVKGGNTLGRSNSTEVKFHKCQVRRMIKAKCEQRLRIKEGRESRGGSVGVTVPK